MPRRSFSTLILVALLLTGLAVVACGDDEPATTDATPTDTQTPAAEATTAATTEDPPAPARPAPDRAATDAAVADAEQAAEGERPSAGGGATVAVQSDTTTTATAGGGTYIVQPGDTLGDIGVRFGTTAAVLAEINQLENPDLLQVGDVLILPGGEPEDDEDAAATDGEDEAADDGTADGEDGEEGDGATEEDSGDEAADDEAAGDDETAPPAGPVAVTGLSPSGIPQPGSDVTAEEIPGRPTTLAEFATTALPWFQDRTEVDEVEPLFIAWAMPVLPRGDRFHLVDTDADGVFSLVAIFTDPGQPQHGSLTDANLVIYDPIPDQPTRWRQAFDHNLAFGGGQDFFVLNVVDMTGDGHRDVLYGETACGAHTCTTIVRLLVRDGDGYRNAAVNVAVPTATGFSFDDVTGDGVPDLTVEGGTYGSVGAGPARPFQFVYSAMGGGFGEIARVGLPTTFRVWVIADGNAAFDAGDYVGALTLYGQAASDAGLDEFVPGAGPDLMAVAALRAAITQLQLGDATAATSLAQAAAAGGGLVGAMATAYLSAIIANPDAAAGCAALNDVLAPRAAEWDAFWEQFGYALPEFRSEQICPF